MRNIHKLILLKKLRLGSEERDEIIKRISTSRSSASGRRKSSKKVFLFIFLLYGIDCFNYAAFILWF